MNDLCRHEGRDAGARRGGVIRGDYLVQEVVSIVTVPLSGINIDREAWERAQRRRGGQAVFIYFMCIARASQSQSQSQSKS